MLLADLAISTITLAIYIPTIVLIWTRMTKIPSNSIYLMLTSLSTVGVIYLGGFISSFLLTIPEYRYLAGQIFSVSVGITIIGLLLFLLSLLIPDFKEDILFYVKTIGITIIYTFAATYNALTVKIIPTSNTFTVIYHPIGLFGLFISLSILLIISRRRIRKIKAILAEETPEPFRTLPFQTSFFFLLIAQFGSIAVTRLFPSLGLPALTWFLPSILTILFLGVSLYKHPFYLFVTDIKLDAILIVEKKTGLAIYSESKLLLKARPVEDVLASISKGLNLSLKKFLDAKKPLEKIVLGDKTVLLCEGKFITTLLIISRDNIFVRDICSYLTKAFESAFADELRTNQTLVLEKFISFSEITEVIKQFFISH